MMQVDRRWGWRETESNGSEKGRQPPADREYLSLSNGIVNKHTKTTHNSSNETEAKLFMAFSLRMLPDIAYENIMAGIMKYRP
tara:strand:+ start:1624 stop:1872 length:249 start_codon:yes stop_codon:yes gene_type:complete